MIYEKAQTAQDISRFLCSSDKPIIIGCTRQTGKTFELLKYAEENNNYGQFCVVCLNLDKQKLIIRTHWMIVNRVDQTTMVTKRLLGEPIWGIQVTPPLILTPNTIHLIRGHRKPIFVDDWGLLPTETQRDIIATWRLVAAVTS